MVYVNCCIQKILNDLFAQPKPKDNRIMTAIKQKQQIIYHLFCFMISINNWQVILFLACTLFSVGVTSLVVIWSSFQSECAHIEHGVCTVCQGQSVSQTGRVLVIISHHGMGHK